MGRTWRRWRKPTSAPRRVESLDDSLSGHVIVAGYGRSGKAAAHALQRAEISLVVVEISHSVFAGLAIDGFSGIWGDITGEEILKAARIEKARILLLTVPDQSTVRLSVDLARLLNPAISVIARAKRTGDVLELRKLGVDAIIQPEFEGGLAMVRQALVQYTGDGAAASQLISDLRAEFYDAGDVGRNPL
jgi:CPA2 family monovalent cation:H+ antiporter-2